MSSFGKNKMGGLDLLLKSLTEYPGSELIKALEDNRPKGEIESLLNNGVDPNTTTPDGFTALYIACQNSNVDAAKVLINAGANTHISVPGGATPIHMAAENGCTEIVELCLRSGVSPDLRGPLGCTPLVIATFEQQDYFDICKLLLESGANPNATNNQFRTPLYIAAEQGRVRTAELLITYGAAINHCSTSDGIYLYTPISLALKGALKGNEGCWEIVKILFDKGVTLSSQYYDPSVCASAAKLTGKAERDNNIGILSKLNELASLREEIEARGFSHQCGVVFEK